MKKSILPFGLFFFTMVAAHSATVITGSLNDSVWNRDGSPYQIQGQVEIPGGTTVKVGHGVLVDFAPGASLEVRGVLRVNGEAAFPAQIRIPAGGACLNVHGGELYASDAKFTGGFFVVDDGKVELTACEITGGSGPYLRGSSIGVFRSNKIYGNSCGFTLDGDQVHAKFFFNTFVMNTYGLHLKKYAALTFVNNSIHDNVQYQVVNDLSTPAALGSNTWGTLTSASVAMRGTADLEPLKSLNDVLREYIRTQLPDLPAGKMEKVIKRAKAEKAMEAADRKKVAELRKKEAAADARAAKAKKLAELKAEKAAKRKELAEKKAAEKAAATAAAGNTSFGELETTQPAAPAAAPAEAAVETAPAPAAEVPAAQPAPAAETQPAAASAAQPAPAAAEAPALAAPPAGPPDLPGLVEPPGLEAPPAAAPAVAAPAAPAAEAPPVTTPVASSAAPAAPGAPAAATPATTDNFNAAAIPAPPGGAAPAIPGDVGAPPDLKGLDLPPMNDKPIQPPKDLDLPPLDDLGGLKMDVK